MRLPHLDRFSTMILGSVPDQMGRKEGRPSNDGENRERRKGTQRDPATLTSAKTLARKINGWMEAAPTYST